MRRYLLAALGTIALAAAMGCGAEGAPNPDPGADGGASNCSLYLAPPAEANVGQEVEVGAILDSSISGIITYTWSIRRDGVEQSLTELSDPVDRVSFVPADAGPYEVLVEASVAGFDCQPAVGDINVLATGALSSDYRMRIQPASGAPMQDVSVRIYGGADAILPLSALEVGVAVSGQVVDSAGNPVAAYVRARRQGVAVQTDYEAFADESGAFAMRVPSASFDLTIVPQDPALPSHFAPGRSAQSLNEVIALPLPVGLSGQVFDAGGDPVAGARVHLWVNGSRSTESSSAGDGSFTVQGIAGQLTGLSVAPPEGSGLPVLRADSLAAQSIGSGSDLVIRFAQGTVSAQVDLRLAGGSAAPGARAEFRAELASAGSIELAQVEPVSGSLRVAATANGSGLVQTPLCAVDTDLVVLSADDSQGRVLRDVPWATAPAQVVTLANTIAAPFVVQAPGSPLDARVRAHSLDRFAPQVEGPQSVADADGAATLQLVRGGNYLVSASHARQGQVSQLLENVQPGLPGTELTLPGTITAKGTLGLNGGVAAGAQVTLYCASCTGELASVATASAVSDGAGRFVLRVPDPGVAAP